MSPPDPSQTSPFGVKAHFIFNCHPGKCVARIRDLGRLGPGSPLRCGRNDELRFAQVQCLLMTQNTG